MPDTHQVTPARRVQQRVEGRPDFRVGQVHPADHPGDEVGLKRDREELVGFLEARSGLDEDGFVNAGFLKEGAQVGRGEVAPDWSQRRVVQPRIADPAGKEEVLVGIDDHGRPLYASATVRWVWIPRPSIPRRTT